jgi:Family of unknown function (DUF6090)
MIFKMIKFFRHIRKRLIIENRFSKYLLYAVGEIFLVVIGILLALQINTTNENQKLKKQERHYLNRLIEENKKDVTTFNLEIQRLEDNNTKIKEFSEALINSTISDTLLIQHASDYMIYGSLYPVFNPSISTYQDLASTGNLSIIQDTKLRDQIVGHYTAYEFVQSNFQINKDWAIPIDAPLFINTNALQFDTNFTSFLFREESIATSAENLRKNEDLYLRNAALHYWINEDCIGYLKQITEDTDKLIISIESKIKNTND